MARFNLNSAALKFKLQNLWWTYLNGILPKKERVLLIGDGNQIEANAVEMANYIRANYSLPVLFIVRREKERKYLEKLLFPGIRFLQKPFIWSVLTSKYVFFTSDLGLKHFSKRQTAVNLWHGVGYKKVGENQLMFSAIQGGQPDWTIVTSELTQKIYAKAFYVSKAQTLISGYPRNDRLVRAKKESETLRKRFKKDFDGFDKILLWLPTFRDRRRGWKSLANNPFEVRGFDAEKFNGFLKKHKALCLLKPHPAGHRAQALDKLSNIEVIGEDFYLEKGMTLYGFLACTDLLISDYSSVIVDYLLLDRPIICLSDDVEEYRERRGLYFDDYEAWVPSKLLTNQDEFTAYLDLILKSGKDPSEEKRLKLKHKFFTHFDALSAKRIAERVFGRIDER